MLLIIETGFSLVVAGFFMICRPYKRNINNLIDFSIFLLLSILSGLCLIEPDSHLGLGISEGLLFVPFILFSIHVLYLLLKRMKICATKCFCRRRQTLLIQIRSRTLMMNFYWIMTTWQHHLLIVLKTQIITSNIINRIFPILYQMMILDCLRKLLGTLLLLIIPMENMGVYSTGLINTLLINLTTVVCSRYTFNVFPSVYFLKN